MTSISTLMSSADNSKFVEVQSTTQNLQDNVYEKVGKAVNEWCQLIKPNMILRIGEIIPILNNHSDVIAYSASIFQQNTPYGYANVDLTMDMPVYDSIIEYNTKSVYDSIVDNVKSKSKSLNNSNFNKIIITNSQLDYYVRAEYDSKINYYNYDGDIVSKNVFSSMDEATLDAISSHKVYGNYDSIMTNMVPTGYTIKRQKKLSIPVLFSEEYVEKKTKKYACVVVALCSVAYQNKIAKSSFKKTFDDIWKYTKTSVDSKENGITYGNTYDYNITNGMNKYVNSINKKLYVFTEKNPKIGFFSSAIDVGDSTTLSFRYYVSDNGKSRKVGHTVSVFGYAITKNKKNNRTANYLMVANGWVNKTRYINYTEVDFVDGYGVEYCIS